MLAESTNKCHRTGKSLACSSSTPVISEFDEDILESARSSQHPSFKTLTKKEIKFLSMGREAYFKSQKILRGRTIHPEITDHTAIKKSLALLAVQGWVDTFLHSDNMIFDIEVVVFYANLTMIEDSVLSSSVHGIYIVFDKTRLGAILRIPCIGLEEYHWVKMKVVH